MMHKYTKIRLILYLRHDLKIIVKEKKLQNYFLPFFLNNDKGGEILLACILQEEVKSLFIPKDAKKIFQFSCVKFASSQIVRRKTCLLAHLKRRCKRTSCSLLHVKHCILLACYLALFF